jgi:alcohol dehydrogenase (cytochrome c)
VYQTNTHFYGGKIVQDPIEQSTGVLAAVDVAIGKPRWELQAPAPMLANVTATESGIVFAGDLKGILYAVNSDTGDVLWHYSLPASAGGGIFTYQLANKQYLAALSGSVSAFFGGGKETTKITVLALP